MTNCQEENKRLGAELDAARSEISRLAAREQEARQEQYALRSSEQNMRGLFTDAHDAMLISSLDLRIMEANNKAVDLFQTSRERLFTLNLRRDLFRPRSPLEKISEMWPRLLSGESIAFYWVALLPEDKRLFPVETVLKRITWNNQDAVLVTIRDRTRRRQVKNILKRRRKLLATILDTNPIATFVIDTDHRVIFWNKACEILTGVSKKHCLGKPVDSAIFYSGPPRPVLADLVLEMDRKRIHALYQDKNLTASSFIPEAYEASDRLVIQGIPRDIYFLAARCRDEHGQIIAAIETIQDITERTRVEQELKASKKLLTEITANIPGVVYQYQVRDFNCVFSFISDGVRTMFDLHPERVMRDPDLFFGKVGPEVRERFESALCSPSHLGQLVDFEFSMDSKTGTKWFKNSSLATVDSRGMFSWNGVITDITEIKRIELMRADVERMVRHDLKSPLTGIGGLAKLLLKDKLPNRQREIVVTIYQSAMKLLYMISHSIILFKMEEQTYELKPVEFDLVQMLRSLHEEFLPSAQTQSLEFLYLLDNSPMSWEDVKLISGEVILLESLFANLIQNAVDAAPQGSRITISVRSTEKFHEIDIHNFGAIPERIRHNFFDRYVTFGKEHGTGIGTYSAMLIAKTHQGDIRFTTSEAEGTHLVVSLPTSYAP